MADNKHYPFKDDIDLINRPHGFITDSDNSGRIDEMAKDIKDIRRKVFSKGKKYWYENGRLTFKLPTGSFDQINFSKAEKSKKVFEAFWYLWEKGEKGEYNKQQVLDMYKRLHNESPWNRNAIGVTVSNIKSKIIGQKSFIFKKIEWQFDYHKQKWIFRINL
ncbi:hypothetical protein A2768_01510 [Candidatus Roizmanbacteria bacterium RIFCSPHIGHO2_01_FULL_37_16]|nr:MAG: hypothetical protein A2768_01510 [Candidatus Roizmanbacteria bacterium RIFCSPHIGHO2_01_FULL_37_16]